MDNWEKSIVLYRHTSQVPIYILMDDDIQLGWTRKVARFKDPWRSFEEFLFRVQPAVAALSVFKQVGFGPHECYRTGIQPNSLV